MANEETSRTAETRDGSMKPIMTTANEPGPALFRAPQPPGNGGLWAQIRQNLELAAKLLPLAWSVFLFVGGLNFLFYYGSIHFVPDLDLKASITVLVTSASIGTILLIILSATLIGPALSWLGTINDKKLKSFWYDEGTKFLRRSAILWFILPLAGFGAAVLLMFAGWQWWGTLSFHVGFPVSLSLILIITGWSLRRRLPNYLNKQDEWPAMIALLGSTLCSIVMLGPLVVLVIATIGADQEYYTYQTVWILIAVCITLLCNTAIVVATSLPTLKFLFATFVFLVIPFLVFPFARPIPKGTMNWFQFGNIEHASLILDEVGCNISRNYKLSAEQPVSDQKTCVLPDVMILSRLGTPYYIQMAGTPQKRLTIPAQNVLSWSVIEPKKTTPTGSPQNPQNPASTIETTRPNDNSPSKEN